MYPAVAPQTAHLLDLAGEVQAIAQGSWRHVALEASGHALRSLEAALWAFASADGFEACLLAAVNLGTCLSLAADTVGAIAGQLAGAHYGLEGIPEALISGLQQAERFLALADRLALGASTVTAS